MELEYIDPASIGDNKCLYVGLRAEIIKFHHDKHNRHNYECTTKHALKLAQSDFIKECNWEMGLKISLEDLLLLEVEECYNIVRNRGKVLVKAWLKKIDEQNDGN